MKKCPKCNTSHIKPGVFCSRKCANSRGPMSNQQKDYRRKWAKQNPRGAILDKTAQHKGGKTTSSKRIYTKKERITLKCRECSSFFEVIPSETYRKYCPKCASKYHGGYQKNSIQKIRSIYKGFQMDSSSERKFAQLLDFYNIKWIKNSDIKFEYLPNKYYYPDFYLPDYELWIEIKAKFYLREHDNLRWKSVPNHEVIWYDDIKLPSKLVDHLGIEPSHPGM